MFQTDAILALQSIPGDLFRILMLSVSGLGTPAVGFLLALLLLNVDLHKGFLLTQILAVTAIATTLLKAAFALPRPLYVDTDVEIIDSGIDYPARFDGMGADGFFAPLPQAVVDAHRALPDPSWGFPSGHVSATAALCVTLIVLYRRRWLMVPAVSFVAAVAAARLYLGKHFLADVLAGALVGGAIALLGHALVSREAGSRSEPRTARASMLLRYGYLVALPVVLMFTPYGQVIWYSSLLGVNLGYLALRTIKQRSAAASWKHRAGRTAIAALLIVVLVPLAVSVSSAPEAARPIAYGAICFVVVAVPGLSADRLLRQRRP